MAKHNKPLMMNVAIKRPLFVRKGLSGLLTSSVLRYIDSIIGNREEAASTHTATSNILQEGVGGMTDLIA